jgi:hypothetical protein
MVFSYNVPPLVQYWVFGSRADDRSRDYLFNNRIKQIGVNQADVHRPTLRITFLISMPDSIMTDVITEGSRFNRKLK